MALTKLTTDLENIQALSDTPNSTEGLTADELKALFDKGPTDIKTYINDTLTDEIDTAIGLRLLASLKAIGTDVTAGTEDTKYVTAKAIKDAAVDLGAWTAYTPSTQNLTIGNGTLTAAYCRIGKTVNVKVKFILGSTSAIGTNPTFSLPSAAKNATNNVVVHILDAGTADYYGLGANSTTSIAPFVYTTGASYLASAPITSTVPMTWTTNDYIEASAIYEAA